MYLGILRRFQEKKVQYFFRDFNFGRKIQRLLLIYLIILRGDQDDCKPGCEGQDEEAGVLLTGGLIHAQGNVHPYIT